MPEPKQDNKLEELLLQRNTRYGGAWLTSNQMMIPVMNEFLAFCQKAPLFIYAWIIILNKLTRILADPYYKDSWVDIAGYATLVTKYLEEQEELNGSTEG